VKAAIDAAVNNEFAQRRLSMSHCHILIMLSPSIFGNGEASANLVASMSPL
jgi:hypothetical protein